MGKLPWGVLGIYIQSYTFWKGIGCKPDSAAALKALKGGARLGKSGGFQGL